MGLVAENCGRIALIKLILFIIPIVFSDSYAQTFIKFLSDKINSYKSKATPDINNDQLHSALAISYLVDQHALPINDHELNKLWDGLLLSPCSEDISVTVLQSLRRQFGSYLK